MNETGIRRFTFEQDLRQSRVYKRVRRRNSLESLSSSTAPSFGWSCLSEMSLANVSNISVISLPIAVSELTNGEHYKRASIAQLVLENAEFPRLGVVGTTPEDDHKSAEEPDSYPINRIAILGKHIRAAWL